MPIIKKLNKHEPVMSPIAALKLPFLHKTNVEVSSGNEVAIAKKIAPAIVSSPLNNLSLIASVTYVMKIDVTTNKTAKIIL